MLTPEQRAKIAQKEAATPDALKRDPNGDYREGYFFVTLNTRNEAPILSTIAGHVGGEGADAPHCEYTELGEAVMKCWHQIPTFNPNIQVIAAEAMPDHFHGLLHITAYRNRDLGRAIGGFMAGCSHAYWDVLGIPWRDMKSSAESGSTSAHTGAIARSSALKGRSDPRFQDRDHTRSYRGPALFVHGYNDTIPITPEQVQIKVAYIRDQALKRLIKGERHQCFAIHRHQHTRSWSMGVALRAVTTDRVLARSAHRLEEEWRTHVCPRLNYDAEDQSAHTAAGSLPRGRSGGESLPIGLDYLGHPALLAAERKLPLVCHSADAHRFEEQCAAVLDAARHGAVIVSAFISPRERDIMKQLLIEQLPVIEITDNGFPDRYKPVGAAFYAVAENRLVQISCWSYLYQRDGVEVSRGMCMVMNELARVISGTGDDWWKRYIAPER